MPAGRRKARTPTEKVPTRRVVLERVQVYVFPDSLSADARTLKAIADGGGEGIVAWVERGEQDGAKMKDAIDAYVQPGQPGQKTGEFRAVPVTNWKGGRRYVQPELVPVQAEALD